MENGTRVAIDFPVDYSVKTEQRILPIFGFFHIQTHMREDLLTLQEAAAYLGVSRSWLNQHQASGDGPVRTKLGRVRYLRRDLDAYIEKRRVTQCLSIKETHQVPSGGTASKSTGGRIGGQLARQIADELRESNAVSARRSKRQLRLAAPSDASLHSQTSQALITNEPLQQAGALPH